MALLLEDEEKDDDAVVAVAVEVEEELGSDETEDDDKVTGGDDDAAGLAVFEFGDDGGVTRVIIASNTAGEAGCLYIGCDNSTRRRRKLADAR